MLPWASPLLSSLPSALFTGIPGCPSVRSEKPTLVTLAIAAEDCLSRSAPAGSLPEPPEQAVTTSATGTAAIMAVTWERRDVMPGPYRPVRTNDITLQGDLITY